LGKNRERVLPKGDVGKATNMVKRASRKKRARRYGEKNESSQDRKVFTECGRKGGVQEGKEGARQRGERTLVLNAEPLPPVSQQKKKSYKRKGEYNRAGR